MTLVVRLWPLNSASKSPLGSKLSAPLAAMVNRPPLEPATAVPTLPAEPLTCSTVSASPCGSLSAPLGTVLVMTLRPVSTLFSPVAKLSSRATGPVAKP